VAIAQNKKIHRHTKSYCILPNATKKREDQPTNIINIISTCYITIHTLVYYFHCTKQHSNPSIPIQPCITMSISHCIFSFLQSTKYTIQCCISWTTFFLLSRQKIETAFFTSAFLPIIRFQTLMMSTTLILTDELVNKANHTKDLCLYIHTYVCVFAYHTE